MYSIEIPMQPSPASYHLLKQFQKSRLEFTETTSPLPTNYCHLQQICLPYHATMSISTAAARCELAEDDDDAKQLAGATMTIMAHRKKAGEAPFI
jgi:hypothetical protein